MAINPATSGLWAALRDPRFAPSQRAQAVAGLGGSSVPDLSSAFQLGEQYGAAEEEDEMMQGGGMGMGGAPGMTGDSSGVSDLHPMLIELTRKAMQEGDTPTREDKGMALAQAGFAMAAGDSPHALQNIGRGAMVGAQSLQEMQQKRALQRMKEVQAASMMARAMRPSTQALPEIGKLQAYRQQLISQYGPEHPMVKEVDAKIAGADQQQAVFKQQIAALRAANPQMSEQEATNAILLEGQQRTTRAQQSGAVQLDDGTVAVTRFNPGGPNGGDYEMQGSDGKWIPVPPTARPTTPSVGAPLNRTAYEKKSSEFLNEIQGLKRADKYFKTVQDASQGIDVIADQMMAKVNTAFERGLSPEQFAAMENKAKLQSLLGMMRVDVVGPGAMTEYDAQRVLDSLGGDITMLRNKEVVREVLGDMFQSKYERAKKFKRDLAYSAPTFGDDPEGFELYEPKYLLQKKPSAVEAAGPGAGSGSDGGAAGAGSGKRRIRLGADGKVIP